jgi:peroxiredoxin family protein
LAGGRRKPGKRGKKPGTGLFACKILVDMMDMGMEDFVEAVIDIVTAGDFMDMIEGAQIVFI